MFKSRKQYTEKEKTIKKSTQDDADKHTESDTESPLSACLSTGDRRPTSIATYAADATRRTGKWTILNMTSEMKSGRKPSAISTPTVTWLTLR